MKSNKASLFFAIQSSDLIFSQKNELLSRVFDLSEEEAQALCEKIGMDKDNEALTRELAKHFGLPDMTFRKEEKAKIL